MREPRNVSGYCDSSEAQNVVLSRWLQLIEETFRVSGFSRMFLQPQELFSQNERFNRVKDEQAMILGISSDRLLPLAHWVAENYNNIIFPYKRYGVFYNLRAEGRQDARFPGIIRADIDIIDYKTLDLSVDAECIFVMYEILRKLGVEDVIIYLNHIMVAKSILSTVGGLSDEEIKLALPIIYCMPKLGMAATAAALLVIIGMDAAKAKATVKLFAYKGTPENFLEASSLRNADVETAISELDAVFTNLVNLGVPKELLSFWPGNLQEFTYYSGVIHKIVVPAVEPETVAMGGRYDNLIPMVSPLQLPGVSGSIDITRLFAIASQRGWIDLSKRSESHIFVGFRSPDLKILAQYLAVELRGRGLRVDLYSGAGNVKKQFTYAGNKGIPVLVMIMDGAAYVVRNLLQGTQVEVPTIERAAEEAAQLITKTVRENKVVHGDSGYF